jgi:hypothetical protein
MRSHFCQDSYDWERITELAQAIVDVAGRENIEKVFFQDRQVIELTAFKD